MKSAGYLKRSGTQSLRRLPGRGNAMAIPAFNDLSRSPLKASLKGRLKGVSRHPGQPPSHGNGK